MNKNDGMQMKVTTFFVLLGLFCRFVFVVYHQTHKNQKNVVFLSLIIVSFYVEDILPLNDRSAINDDLRGHDLTMFLERFGIRFGDFEAKLI